MYRSSIAVIVACLILPGPSSIYSDNLGSLVSTLKDMHRMACDNELVTLACPTGTVINIQEAKYGKPATVPEHTCLEDLPGQVMGDDCLWPNPMQYSLLQTVVEACQKKSNCQFSTKLMAGANDPCPHARKFVRVAFKCKPPEFRSRVVCEDDILKLSCNPYSRVAVFDAEYGRTAFDSECSQKGLPEENCKAPNAASRVMQICHGKRRCEIEASGTVFGNPCQANIRVYLRVVYACVPLGVLTKQFETALEADEAKDGVTKADRGSDLFDSSVNAGDRWTDTSIVTPMANPALQPPPKPVSTKKPYYKDTDANGSRKPDKSEKENTEASHLNIFIYIGISILLFIILCILLIGVRCYIIRKNKRNSKNGDMFIAEAPNVFSDAVSDIDNDIDVTHISGTFYDPAHPDMILYRDVPGNKGALRAMRPLSTIYPCAGASMYGTLDYIPPQYREVAAGRLSREASREKEDAELDHELVVSPKSLSRFSNSQYYYG